jgi:hypothetical protein
MDTVELSHQFRRASLLYDSLRHYHLTPGRTHPSLHRLKKVSTQFERDALKSRLKMAIPVLVSSSSNVDFFISPNSVATVESIIKSFTFFFAASIRTHESFPSSRCGNDLHCESNLKFPAIIPKNLSGKWRSPHNKRHTRIHVFIV